MESINAKLVTRRSYQESFFIPSFKAKLFNFLLKKKTEFISVLKRLKNLSQHKSIGTLYSIIFMYHSVLVKHLTMCQEMPKEIKPHTHTQTSKEIRAS